MPRGHGLNLGILKNPDRHALLRPPRKSVYYSKFGWEIYDCALNTLEKFSLWQRFELSDAASKNGFIAYVNREHALEKRERSVLKRPTAVSPGAGSMGRRAPGRLRIAFCVGTRFSWIDADPELLR